MNPTTFDFKNSTPAQRNEACARFLPPSDVNPIRSWHLQFVLPARPEQGQPEPVTHDAGQLMVKSRDEALAWLKKLGSSRKAWKRAGIPLPWSYSHLAQIAEDERHVNYTNTPGGAWMLIEHLKAQSYSIVIGVQEGITRVSATKVNHLAIEQAPTVGFIGAEPFHELIGMLFLKLNGVELV